MTNVGNMGIPIYTKLGRKKYNLGTYALNINAVPDEDVTPILKNTGGTISRR